MTHTAQLTARKPFNSFTVPGVSPSVVVSRRQTRLSAESAKALKSALKKGEIPGVSPEDVLIQEVDAPASPAPSACDDERIEDLEAQLAEAREAAQADAAEKSARIEDLEAQLAGSDASALATGILDSLTVPELTKLAKARGAEHASDANKAAIVSAIVRAGTGSSTD